MDWLWQSHRAGRIFGIEIRIAYSLYLFLGFLALSHSAGVPPLIALANLLILAALPFCILLHELGHSVAAIHRGLRVPRITLTMIGGRADMEGLGNRPKSEILIAAAGPAVSFALAGLSFVPYFFAASAGMMLPAQVFGSLFMINLVLGLFNLLPVYPMDGGRIAASLLMLRCGEIPGLSKTVTLSKYGAIAMGAVGFFLMMSGGSNGMLLMLIAWFIYNQGRLELMQRLAIARSRANPTPTPWSNLLNHPVHGVSQGVWIWTSDRR